MNFDTFTADEARNITKLNTIRHKSTYETLIELNRILQLVIDGAQKGHDHLSYSEFKNDVDYVDIVKTLHQRGFKTQQDRCLGAPLIIIW